MQPIRLFSRLQYRIKFVLIAFCVFFSYGVYFIPSTIKANSTVEENVLTSTTQSIVDGNHTYFVDGNKLVSYYGPAGDIKIPDGIEIIGNNVFENRYITSVVLPNSLITIEEEAFKRTNLTKISFPSSLKTIGDSAFYLSSLESVEIPGSIETISSWAFAGNRLTDVKINEGVKNIKKYAFYGNSLSDVVFPASVSSISEHAFEKNQIDNITFLGQIPTFGFKWINNQGDTNKVVKLYYYETFFSWYEDPAYIAYSSNVVIELNEVEASWVDRWEVSIPIYKADSSTLIDLIRHKYKDDHIVQVSSSSYVEFDKLGRYRVYFHLIDDMQEVIEVIAWVEVIESIPAPTIISSDLSFKADNFSLQELLSSAKATDYYGRDLVVEICDHNIKFETAGEYDLEYRATDEFQNFSTSKVSVTVTPNNKPIIKSKDIEFAARTFAYENLLDGVSASDLEDGEVEVKVKEHNIDFGLAGDYYVIYQANDSEGNIVEKTNNVRVRSNEIPYIYFGELHVYKGEGKLEDINSVISAIDFEDGVLTVKILNHNVNFNKVGTYFVTVEAIDSDNNRVQANIPVIVSFHISSYPNVTTTDYSSEVGNGNVDDFKYSVNCNDKEDGKLEFVIISHNVNFNRIGNYKILGYCKDSDGLQVDVEINAYIHENHTTDGWHLRVNKWMYYLNGKPVNGWTSINGLQYYFEDRRMKSDWWLDENTGAWYFFNGGVMQRSNLLINGKVNIFDSNGVWKGIKHEDGWILQPNNRWKYYKDNKAVNGWQSIGGLQYYFENTEMVSDWWLDSNTGAWYFFNGGVMQRSNILINGKINIFDTYGVWKGILK